MELTCVRERTFLFLYGLDLPWLITIKKKIHGNEKVFVSINLYVKTMFLRISLHCLFSCKQVKILHLKVQITGWLKHNFLCWSDKFVYDNFNKTLLFCAHGNHNIEDFYLSVVLCAKFHFFYFYFFFLLFPSLSATDTVNFLGISIVGQSNKGGDGGIYVGSIMKGLVQYLFLVSYQNSSFSVK